MADVRFLDATRVFHGAWRPAVDGVSLDVRDGELLVLTGPSGSGKTTLLRMLAGLEPMDRGSVLIGGKDVGRTAPDKRGVSMIFQGFALFPHQSIRENIALPLTMRKNSAKSAAARVQQVAELCGIADHLNSKPDSVGYDVRQRATMARAIVRRPEVVCLDEPLAGSGVPLMMRGRSPIAALQRELRITTLYATCSSIDAWTIADRIAVLDSGRVQQLGTPAEVFDKPATIAVAQFLGQPGMNLVTAAVSDGVARVGGLAVALTSTQASTLTGRRVVIGIRAEDLAIGAEADGIRATTVLVRDTGRDYLVTARMMVDGEESDLVVRHASGPVPAKGESVVLGVRAGAALHLFDAGNGVRLPD
ncbi:ABC transporter ATP-binding protein [Catenulispora sp. NL8]|uniref:ABC transporter ATP-binding protein n=2 Tax=Catenulispora pinistramenti TaxID=2705254 RepID=A0ABS5L1X7_9ACTN|nr:ABC transporter ATP-binding protein [Catenulispora pinistramenti]MBS2552301.1 ABC transporter ATP-binding protein [Catenulispora pinistramenti]